MSLHEYIVPPPLALAVHPALPSNPRPAESDKDKSKSKDKDKEKDKDKGKDKDKDKDKDEGEDGGKEGKPGKDDKHEGDNKHAEQDKDKKSQDKHQNKHEDGEANAEADVKKRHNPADNEAAPAQPASPATPDTPGTPGSMFPEPPTPVPGALNHVEQKANVPAPNKKDKSNEKNDGGALAAAKGEAGDKDEVKVKVDSDAAPATTKGKEGETPTEKEAEAELEIEPLRLLPPVPPWPLRAKLDLNPSTPYPPINTDPRGAYHKYARAFYRISDHHHIDITRDGWITPLWKERAEREALSRLRGDTDAQLERESQKAWQQRVGARKVPATSEGVLLDLWNDLAQATNHELEVDIFWARYDWSTPEARIHLLDVKRADPALLAAEKESSSPTIDAAATADADAGITDSEVKSAWNLDAMAVDGETQSVELGPDEVQWTKEGVEEILGTVGLRCDYNTEKPLPRIPSEPSCAFLLLAHNHFLLRLKGTLQWQRERPSDDFQMMVVDHRDRVFGEMVIAQMMEEKRRKDREYKERKEREKKAKAKADTKEGKDAKDGRADDKDADAKDGKEDKEGREGEAGAKLAKGEADQELADKVKDLHIELKHKDASPAEDPQEPGTPSSNRKVKDGEEVKPHDVAVEGAGVPDPVIAKDVVVIAVPVDGDPHAKAEANAKADGCGDGDKDKAKERDARHDADKKVVGVIALDDSGAKGEGKKDGEAGTEVEGKLKMDEIAVAFQALEMVGAKGVKADEAAPPASDKPKAEKTDAAEKDKEEAKELKKKEPFIWTWTDHGHYQRCEKWRWKNYEAGAHIVGPGGWEERDWKVFADDREVWDWEADEAEIEIEEEDLHDWSC